MKKQHSDPGEKLREVNPQQPPPGAPSPKLYLSPGIYVYPMEAGLLSFSLSIFPLLWVYQKCMFFREKSGVSYTTSGGDGKITPLKSSGAI